MRTRPHSPAPGTWERGWSVGCTLTLFLDRMSASLLAFHGQASSVLGCLEGKRASLHCFKGKMVDFSLCCQRCVHKHYFLHLVTVFSFLVFISCCLTFSWVRGAFQFAHMRKQNARAFFLHFSHIQPKALPNALTSILQMVSFVSQSFSLKILRTRIHCLLDFESVEKSEARLETGIFSSFGLTQFVFVSFIFCLFVSYESLLYA